MTTLTYETTPGVAVRALTGERFDEGDLVSYRSRRLKTERVGLIVAIDPFEIGTRPAFDGVFQPRAFVLIADPKDGSGVEVRKVKTTHLTVLKREFVSPDSLGV